MDETRAAEIAALNDTFRRSRGEVFITRGVQTLNDGPGLMRAVVRYDAFTEDNDPYGEHDFGVITWDSETVYWKIDYYDRAMEHWCDPLSPLCNRVLTVLLAEEW